MTPAVLLLIAAATAQYERDAAAALALARMEVIQSAVPPVPVAVKNPVFAPALYYLPAANCGPRG